MVSNDGGGFTKTPLVWVAALSANWLADVTNRLGIGCCPWILTLQFSSSWCEYTFNNMFHDVEHPFIKLISAGSLMSGGLLFICVRGIV
jgi:hypothetical protein